MRRIVVATTHEDLETQNVCRQNEVECVLSNACYDYGEAFNKGRMLNAALDVMRPEGWTLFTDADCFLPDRFDLFLADISLSDDTLYFMRRVHLQANADRPSAQYLTNLHLRDKVGNDAPWGYFQLFYAPVAADRCGGRLRFPECFCSAGGVDKWFMRQWRGAPVERLPPALAVHHLWHGDLAGRWNTADQRGIVGWKWAGQLSSGPESHWMRRWYAPCEVRRTCIETCESHVLRYDGRPRVDWPTRFVRGLDYEYAVRPLPESWMLPPSAGGDGSIFLPDEPKDVVLVGKGRFAATVAKTLLHLGASWRLEESIPGLGVPISEESCLLLACESGALDRALSDGSATLSPLGGALSDLGKPRQISTTPKIAAIGFRAGVSIEELVQRISMFLSIGTLREIGRAIRSVSVSGGS